jgi:hypothetical protein
MTDFTIPAKGVRWVNERQRNKVITWFDEDGGQHSRSCEDPEAFEWLRAGNKPDEPIPLPPPVTIARWQLFQQLAEDGIVPNEEALDAVKSGEIPKAFHKAIDGMPSKTRFTIEMWLCGVQTIDRTHPMMMALAKGMGWSDEDLLNLWRNAAEKK